MPTPRKQQISLSDTHYYHCMSRCVRRSFLCGFDSITQKDYRHRKLWIEERLALLSHTFAIDVCAYSLMDNHMHSVLKINASLAHSWSDEEVMRRWQLILDQLGLDCEVWLETVNAFSTQFHSFIGPEEKLKVLCQKQAKKWIQGIQLCRKLFSNKRSCPA